MSYLRVWAVAGDPTVRARPGTRPAERFPTPLVSFENRDMSGINQALTCRSGMPVVTAAFFT